MQQFQVFALALYFPNMSIEQNACTTLLQFYQILHHGTLCLKLKWPDEAVHIWQQMERDSLPNEPFQQHLDGLHQASLTQRSAGRTHPGIIQCAPLLDSHVKQLSCQLAKSSAGDSIDHSMLRHC